MLIHGIKLSSEFIKRKKYIYVVQNIFPQHLTTCRFPLTFRLVMIHLCRWRQSNINPMTHAQAAEMSDNVFPCFCSSCAGTVAHKVGGERLKQPVAPRISRPGVFTYQRVKPPCLWARNPNIIHRLQGSLSEPADLSPSAPTFLGLLSSHCGLRSSWKAADRNMRDAYATPPCPHTDTSGDSRARWMTLWGLFLKGGGSSSRALHGTGSWP